MNVYIFSAISLPAASRPSISILDGWPPPPKFSYKLYSFAINRPIAIVTFKFTQNTLCYVNTSSTRLLSCRTGEVWLEQKITGTFILSEVSINKRSVEICQRSESNASLIANVARSSTAVQRSVKNSIGISTAPAACGSFMRWDGLGGIMTHPVTLLLVGVNRNAWKTYHFI